MSQPNIVKVCNKYDILLTKNKDTDVFTIQFSMINNKVDISKLMSFSIYDLIKDLNSDLLDRLEIKEKHSQYMKDYYQKNKQELLIKQKSYYQQNKEKIRAYMKEYMRKYNQSKKALKKDD